MESTYSGLTRSLLMEWARWKWYQSGEVRGYAREVPFYRLMRGASVGGPVITDDQAERVDRAVSRLSQRCPDQAEVIRMYYLDGVPPAKMAYGWG